MPFGGVIKYREIDPHNAAPHGTIVMTASFSVVIQFPLIDAGAANAVPVRDIAEMKSAEMWNNFML